MAQSFSIGQPPPGVAFDDSSSMQLVVQTDDNTPTVVASIPVANDKVVICSIQAAVFSLDETHLAVGELVAVFARRGSSNLLRPGAPTGQLNANNFVAPLPSLNAVANTTTQTIDVVATGQLATSIRWHLDIKIRATS